MCPLCFSIDSSHLKATRELQQNVNTLNSIFSMRMRKKVVYTLTKNNGFKDDSERLKFIAETNDQLKGISDTFCCKELSNIFGIPITKVVETFFKIKRQRQEFSITEYSIDNRIR